MRPLCFKVDPSLIAMFDEICAKLEGSERCENRSIWLRRLLSSFIMVGSMVLEGKKPEEAFNLILNELIASDRARRRVEAKIAAVAALYAMYEEIVTDILERIEAFEKLEDVAEQLGVNVGKIRELMSKFLDINTPIVVGKS